jgi:hypothetical protein
VVIVLGDADGAWPVFLAMYSIMLILRGGVSVTCGCVGEGVERRCTALVALTIDLVGYGTVLNPGDCETLTALVCCSNFGHTCSTEEVLYEGTAMVLLALESGRLERTVQFLVRQLQH